MWVFYFFHQGTLISPHFQFVKLFNNDVISNSFSHEIIKLNIGSKRVGMEQWGSFIGHSLAAYLAFKKTAYFTMKNIVHSHKVLVLNE